MITKRIHLELDVKVDEEFHRRFGIEAEAIWAVGVDVMGSHGVKKILEAVLQDSEKTYIWKPGQGLAVINSVIPIDDVVWVTYSVEPGKKITYDFKGSSKEEMQLAVVLVEDFLEVEA